ncbi:MAG TPA: OmpA family protein, partial [Salinimicrobium sp.]|nr:OmpA family protein [Salinimicrobium sp.]
LNKYLEEGKNADRMENLRTEDEINIYSGLESFRVYPADLNSGYSDFGAYKNNGNLYFTSARAVGSGRDKIYDWNGEPFLDVYVLKADSGIPGPIEGEVNTKRHEGPITISADGKTMFFTRNNYFDNKNGKEDEEGVNHLKIYKATLEAGEWTNIEETPFSSNTYSVGHPSLSADGKTLYFASEQPGGQGGSDLYKVSINGNSYGTPENLGSEINTPGNELFPFISEENRLYFSSDGHKGYGLLDVFVVNMDEPGNVENLGEPNNSSLDDFAFSISPDKSEAFVSSNRSGGKGSDDIYRIEITAPLVLKGTVTDSINGKPIPNATVRLLNEDGQQIAFLETDEEGNYNTEIARNKNLVIEAKQIKYDPKSANLSSFEMDEETELVYDIELSPIRDVEYLAEINKIYFDFDKANIRPDAAAELDKLVNLMLNDYPELVIEIGSHTDSRGSVEYNRKLAERRAQSTYDYLVANGIAEDRIVAYKGYGEEKPAVDCDTCNWEQHQLNRRSVFNVVKME